ncbi:cellulose binding domain-containing protein [Sphaerisporangium sp. B11E5]|uniref:cellulose binding domain-containing protein n=1 Tax=Sphaerisporangium sp. B11E5 TaxID=3153563 RepID=UPI00325DE322
MSYTRPRGAALRGLLLGFCAATAAVLALGSGLTPASGAVPAPAAPAVLAAAGAGAGAADTTPPSEPVGLSPRNVYLNGVAGLTWTPSTDDVAVTGYEIFAWSYTSPATTAFEPVQAYVNTFSTHVNADVHGLTPGRAYLFYVVAVDAAGNRSKPSLLVQQRAMREPPQPSPTPGPSNPSAPWDLRVGGGPGPGYVTLLWSYRDQTPTTVWVPFVRSSTDWTRAGDSTLPRTLVRLGTESSYTFQVVARDDVGNLSTPSNAATWTASTSTPTPAPVTCAITYNARSWASGFTADITLKNTGTTPVDGWRLAFDFPTTTQHLTIGWSATWTQSAATVTAANASWNRTIAPGQSLRVGFTGTHTGNNPSPASFTLNGGACAVG